MTTRVLEMAVAAAILRGMGVGRESDEGFEGEMGGLFGSGGQRVATQSGAERCGC